MTKGALDDGGTGEISTSKLDRTRWWNNMTDDLYEFDPQDLRKALLKMSEPRRTELMGRAIGGNSRATMKVRRIAGETLKQSRERAKQIKALQILGNATGKDILKILSNLN